MLVKTFSPCLSQTSLVQSVVLYGSESWTMRKVDSDRNHRIQSFHMQALHRILNQRTKLPVLLLTDVIHYLVTSVATWRTHLLRRHFNCQ